MFGIFKKKVTPGEFGGIVVKYANDILAGDALRSLGMRFENWDGSRGWGTFLESQGVSVPTMKLYSRLFTHSAIQAACTQFTRSDEATRRAITYGAAIEAFPNKPDGYDFETTYTTLAAAYRWQHKFDRRVEPLSNSELKFPLLPNPDVGVLNAKYLIESFVIPNMKNSQSFIDDFYSYSITVCQGVGIVLKAAVHVSKWLKIS